MSEEYTFVMCKSCGAVPGRVLGPCTVGDRGFHDWERFSKPQFCTYCGGVAGAPLGKCKNGDRGLYHKWESLP